MPPLPPPWLRPCTHHDSDGAGRVRSAAGEDNMSHVLNDVLFRRVLVQMELHLRVVAEGDNSDARARRRYLRRDKTIFDEVRRDWTR